MNLSPSSLFIFTHVKIEERLFQVKYITDFQCEVINGKLIYRFFIPCHVRAVEHVKSVRFSMYDNEFYTCFLLISQPVGFAGDENIDVTHKVEKTGTKHTISIRSIRKRSI